MLWVCKLRFLRTIRKSNPRMQIWIIYFVKTIGRTKLNTGGRGCCRGHRYSQQSCSSQALVAISDEPLRWSRREVRLTSSRSPVEPMTYGAVIDVYIPFPGESSRDFHIMCRGCRFQLDSLVTTGKKSMHMDGQIYIKKGGGGITMYPAVFA